jgi:hypothetical protein
LHPGKNAEYSRRYRQRNPEKTAMANRRYKEEHLEEIREKSKERESRPDVRARRKQYSILHKAENAERGRRWCQENPDKKMAKDRRGRQSPKYKKYHLKKVIEDRKRNPERFILRDAVRWMMEHTTYQKKSKSRQYIGCSSGFLRNHLESLFKPGMTWANWGEWHVDHIVPLSWFPFDKDPSLLFVASHWTNLRPLWAIDNLKKKNHYAG